MQAALLLGSLIAHRSLFFFANQLPSLLSTYTVARYDPGRVGRWAWCSGIVFTAALFAAATPEIARQQTSSPVLLVPCGVAAWGCGRVLRRLREQEGELSAALDRLAAEQAARETAAVLAERSRIALDMHDVVVHAVTVMTEQVAEVRAEIEAAGGSVPRLLAAEETGRQALVELAQTLDVLGNESLCGALPGLGATGDLGARFRAAGLDLELQVNAVPGLPAGLELVVYRILQEALTNALKHGGRDSVRAAIRASDGELVIRVRNLVDRAAYPLPSGQHGLVGMRERVTMLGGTLHVEHSPTDFEVRAALPLAAP
jgi:signal transduction histidine kinase